MDGVQKPSTLSARPQGLPGGGGAAHGDARPPIADARADVGVSGDGAPQQPVGTPRKRFQLLDAFEKPIEWLIRFSGWSSIIGVVAIFLFIFREAAPMVPKLDWVHFFTSPRWIPNPA